MSWQPRLALEAELERLEGRLAAEPAGISLRFDRAVTLGELGRSDEAREAYLDLLARAPTHFGALNNLGALLVATGYHTAARTAYAEAVKHHPDNANGRVNFANALARNGELEAAIAHFEAALHIAPDHHEAHQGFARLLADIGDEEAARHHREKGFKERPVMLLPYRGQGQPIALLLLVSAAGGTVPIQHHLDDRVFFTSVLFVDFYDPALPFPPHHLVFNAVGDADVCMDSLKAAELVLQRSNAPVINPPARVMASGRMENARRMGKLPGVVTPKMALLPRAQLGSTVEGFRFPFLLRAPGFHTGRFFLRVEDEAQFADAVAKLPGEELMAIEYLDARSANGKIRKYRVMMIGGVIYPLHAAISHEWKIHYFSAEMADNPENRAEDAAFLADMAGVLGLCAMQALEAIRDTLGLDYAGADFSLNAKGEVILFEANATMVVNPPDADARWDYRRPGVQRILDAIGRLLRHEA